MQAPLHASSCNILEKIETEGKCSVQITTTADLGKKGKRTSVDVGLDLCTNNGEKFSKTERELGNNICWQGSCELTYSAHSDGKGQTEGLDLVLDLGLDKRFTAGECNMEIPLRRLQNTERTIQASVFPEILM